MSKMARKSSLIIFLLLVLPLSIAVGRREGIDADSEYKFACSAYRAGNVEEAMKC